MRIEDVILLSFMEWLEDNDYDHFLNIAGFAELVLKNYKEMERKLVESENPKQNRAKKIS